MLIATIIINKYQQHLFNISTLVFKNILQCTLESFACGTRLFFGDSSSILVASSSFTFTSDCSFSTLTWLITCFACHLELFLPPSKPLQGEYEDFRDGGITVSFLAESYRKLEVSIFHHFLS